MVRKVNSYLEIAHGQPEVHLALALSAGSQRWLSVLCVCNHWDHVVEAHLARYPDRECNMETQQTSEGHRRCTMMADNNNRQ